MEFGNNLQNLRKGKNLSQEDLADTLSVSRQAISKWESGVGYPEMDKLIKLCEMFNCTMDDLIKGKINTNKQEYDTIYNKFSKAISLGVMIILIGTTSLIQLCGYNDDKMSILGLVILLVCVMIAVPIFIYYSMSVENFQKQNGKVLNIYTESEVNKFNKFYPITVAIGVSLILLGVIALITLYGMELVSNNSTLPVTILLGFVTLATPIFIYYGIQKDKYDVEIYNKEARKLKNKKVDKYSGVIMLFATFIFLGTGFIFNAWKISWVVFPLGGILCGIIGTLFDNNED